MYATANTNLLRRLSDLDITTGSAEEEQLRLFLGMAAGSLARSDLNISSFLNSESLKVVLSTISSRWNGRVRYRGFPPFVSPEVLDLLGKWCVESRKFGSRVDKFAMSHPCAEARQFLVDHQESFRKLLGSDAHHFALNRAMFVHYEESGDRSDPHLDEIDHEVNIVICVRHRHLTSISALRVFGKSPNPEIFVLSPGEAVVFDGAFLVHGREPVGLNEAIDILTVGFRRKENAELHSILT